ncbi:arginine deiminase [Alkaliphilus peptidifermentans]|uniref:Arginine deiminase n=1 Tax=Alkaliphilus peptidifermentans DSM 18978 TaxID=1120976 RepID=A0A1G5KHY7_9FIRM|nr:arginine deiminase [Alkaliphilus peptidifermentans]SCZ00197.1 arginine deiminase [Alkaliphilus peptidifermentans DSM 18978]
MKDGFLNVTSEIGNLKAVLLHRPGRELERLTPDYLHELLFDDIPWLKRMRWEHDGFAKVMEDKGCKVYYYEELLEELLKDKHTLNLFVSDLIKNSHIDSLELEKLLEEYLLALQPNEIVEIAIAGLEKKDLPNLIKEYHLVDYIKEQYPFYINPLPNLYFTRDPGVVIGNGLSINKMKTPARNRETMFLEYIYRFHPLFKKDETPLWYDYKETYSIEGGDVLVLSDSVVAIGCSERTSARGIEILSQRLFQNSNIKKVLAIQIPFTRAYMHLDTVFTMVDHDKFTIYPGVEGLLQAYELTEGKNTPKVRPMESLKGALKTVLNLPDVQLIQSGGGDEITAAREQWNDSTNTLALGPGRVLTYNRNEATNETLRNHGIEVIEIEGSELVRGRGGPRCMSMPLIREAL